MWSDVLCHQVVAQSYNIYISGLRAGHNTTVAQIIICGEEFANQAVVLHCPVGNFINLTYVNWGRTRPYSEVCDYWTGTDRTDCTPKPAITQAASVLCQGQQNCQLTYDGLHLWDTCPNTYKYFEVRYTCMRQCEYQWIWGIFNDDVIKRKDFPSYCPFVWGIHRSPANSPHKGQWRGALMFSLICAQINDWINNREASDLRRHRTYCDVIVMVRIEETCLSQLSNCRQTKFAVLFDERYKSYLAEPVKLARL